MHIGTVLSCVLFIEGIESKERLLGTREKSVDGTKQYCLKVETSSQLVTSVLSFEESKAKTSAAVLATSTDFAACSHNWYSRSWDFGARDRRRYF